MARGFRRRGSRYTARLDPTERDVVVGLMAQVLELVRPQDGPERTRPSAGDAFEDIVAGLAAELDDPQEAEAVPDTPEGLAGRGFGTPARRDPALDRLLPAGNREDEQAAAEYRRLTEPTLRSGKADKLSTAMTALERARGDRVELEQGEALATVVALTDVRLVLGERLGLRTDEDAARVEQLVAELGPDDPMLYALAVYDFLTWLQETLAQAMLPGADTPGGGR